MDSPAPSGYTGALDEVIVISVAEGWPSAVEGVRLEIAPGPVALDHSRSLLIMNVRSHQELLCLRSLAGLIMSDSECPRVCP
jgi:hypothetical protein